MSRSTAKYKYRKYAQDSGLVLKAARWQDYTKEDLAEFGMYLDHVLSEREVPVAQRVFSRQTIAYALEARILLTKMEDRTLSSWTSSNCQHMDFSGSCIQNRKALSSQ